MINYGNRQVIDVKAEAWIKEKRDDRWIPISEIKLDYDGELPALGKRQDYGRISNGKGISPIFYISLKEEELRTKLCNGTRKVFFTLSAKDALSGTVVVQRQLYGEKEIEEGDFVAGFTFKKRSDSWLNS